MAFKRFTMDIAIPMDVDGKLPQFIDRRLRDVFSSSELQALMDEKIIDVMLRLARLLKSHAVKINSGTEREEDSTKARLYICRHDEGLPCQLEQEVPSSMLDDNLPPDILGQGMPRSEP